MVANLASKLRNDDLILRGKVLHMRCCAHILNLIVNEGVAVIESSIERIHDSVQFLSATPSRVEKFAEACKQLDVSYSRKLCLDCKTRCNSTYDMLLTAIGYKEVFYRVQLMDRHYKCLPSDDDWEMAEEICNKLSIFYEVTNLFSGTRYPTANYFFGKVHTIRKALVGWKSSLDANISAMADKMFEKYWGDVHVIMVVCTILDPRSKIKGVYFVFCTVFGENVAKELQNVKDTCYDLIKEYQLRPKSCSGKGISSSSSAPSGSGSGTDVAFSIDPMMEMDEFEQFFMTTSNDDIQVNVKFELDHYLDEPAIPWVANSEFEILGWWKPYGMKYPTLQEIARDLLAIPVSTVASESAFNTDGRIISSHRSRLNPDTIEALMCTQSWLSSLVIGLEIDEGEDEVEEIESQNDK